MSTEVKQGYKRTEVGVIPIDWDTNRFSEIALLERGKFSARPRNDPKYFGGQTPFIQTGDVTNSSGFVTDYSQTLNEAGLAVSKVFKKDTLFFTIAANIGDVAFAAFDAACPDSLIGITPKLSTINRGWLFHELRSRKRNFEGLATQNAQLNINLEKLNPYQLPIPPLKEQEAIASALSDMDTLISGLDQLIAKKLDIQQASMQQLLTGQRRLPGFSGEWEVKRFGEVVVSRSERVDPRSAGRQDFCVELEHIEPRSGRLIGQTVADESSSLKTVFKRQDVLFGKLRAYQRKYWLAERDGVCSTEIWALSCDASFLLPEFLYHSVKTDAFIEVASTAYGTHMPRSDWKVMKQFEISLPTCEEQTAIATILSDMDSELAVLEVRRDKARQLKQGMMQELLTGRIRLA